MKEGFKKKERNNYIFLKSEKKISHNTQNKCVSVIGSKTATWREQRFNSATVLAFLQIWRDAKIHQHIQKHHS